MVTTVRRKPSKTSRSRPTAETTRARAARTGTKTTAKAAAKPKAAAKKATSAARKPAVKPAAKPAARAKAPAAAAKKTVAKAAAPKKAVTKAAALKTTVKAQVKKPAAAPVPALDLAAHDKELTRAVTTTSVNRALDLLEALAGGGRMALPALSQAAGLGVTAAEAALELLRARHFVARDDATSEWCLGARWSVLGAAASEQGSLAVTAAPILAALGQATGENIYLRVRVGMECETVAVHQTDPLLRVYTEVGKRMPLHAGSGRVLLAHAPEGVQTQVLTQRLQRFTPSTRTDPTWIAADLHRIRQRGYLITDSEYVAGTVSVGVPVRDASGQVVATLLIGAPSLRMRPPRPRGLLPAVLDAARKLSEALGFTGEYPLAVRGPAAPPSARMTPPPPGAQNTNGSMMRAVAMGAAMARPHSIFR
jgi:DNA-binding IclR family transcriptional regulator